MNIFIGTNDIAGILSGLKQGFQAIGCNVTTLIKDTSPFYDEEYNYTVLRKFPNSAHLKNKHIRKIVEFADYKAQNWRIKTKLPSIIEQHDVFVFIWQSLQRDYADFKQIKAAGKKIVCIFVGSESRHISAFQQEFGGNQQTWEKGFHEDDINHKIFTIRNAELYADAIFSVPDQAGLAIRPYDHLYLPFNSSKIEFKISENQPLKIIHAPSRTGIKGTAIIVATIEKLKAEGLAFEFKLIQNMSNKQLLQELTNTDILVDELYLHGPGMLGLEAMAAGCAVATHTLSIYKDVFNPPVCNIDEPNLYDQLKKIITDKTYRLQLISEGKEFVQQKNAPQNVAKGILDKLQKTATHDYTPLFFTNHFKLPAHTSISKQNQELTNLIFASHRFSKEMDINRAKREKLISQTSSI